MAESNVAERLKSFIEKVGLSYSQFADRCGIPRPSLSQLLTGRNKKINDTMVGQIHKVFPNLSVVWLLFGEGPMETKSVQSGAEDSDSGKMQDFGSLFPDLPFEEDNFVRQNPESSTEDKASYKNSKENGLKTLLDEAELIGNKESKLSKIIKDLGAQIENLKRNPRKVTQIMVYYDDYTFETFIPSANAIRN